MSQPSENEEGLNPSLFLKYLSTGQVECARLVFRQVFREGSQQDRDRLRRETSLISCGFRPSEWIPSSSCPSQAHLAWQCGQMMAEVDPSVPRPPVSAFVMAVSSLLTVDMGVSPLDESLEAGGPSDRAVYMAEGLLGKEDLLIEALQGDARPVRVVWETLEGFIGDLNQAKRILTVACDQLVGQDRLFDAVRLFACSSQSDASESLAYAVAKSDRAQYQSCLILLARMTSDAKLVHNKLKSLMRYRLANSEHDNTLEAAIVTSMRGSTSTQWIQKLVDSPFSFKDAPSSILALHLLLGTSTADWAERLLEVQKAVDFESETSVGDGMNGCDSQVSRTPMMGEEKLAQFSGSLESPRLSHGPSSGTRGNTQENPIAQAVISRVDRLGFQLGIAQALTGTKDLKSARLAHDLRSLTLPRILANRALMFDSNKIKALSTIIPGPRALPLERDQLNAVRFAIWVAALVTGRSLEEEKEDGDAISATSTFLRGLDEFELHDVAQIFASRIVRLIARADIVSRLVECFNSFSHTNALADVLQVVGARARIAERLFQNSMKDALDMSHMALYLKCMDQREFNLAKEVADVFGLTELAKHAKIAAAMQNNSLSQERGGDEEMWLVGIDLMLSNRLEISDNLIDQEKVGDSVDGMGEKYEGFASAIARVNLALRSKTPGFPLDDSQLFDLDSPLVRGDDTALRIDFPRESLASPAALKVYISSIASDEVRTSRHQNLLTFLGFVSDLSEKLDVTPQDVVDRGIWEIFLDCLSKEEFLSCTLDFCEGLGLDARLLLLSHVSSFGGFEVQRALNAAEERQPIQGLRGGPVLSKLFITKDSVRLIDEYPEYNALSSPAIRPSAGSDFSLKGELDEGRPMAGTLNEVRKPLDCLVWRDANQKDWWEDQLMTVESREAWLTSAEILVKIRSGQWGADQVEDHIDAVGRLTDEDLTLIAACFVGIESQSSTSKEFAVDDTREFLDPEACVAVLDRINDDSARTEARQVICDALSKLDQSFSIVAERCLSIIRGE